MMTTDSNLYEVALPEEPGQTAVTKLGKRIIFVSADYDVTITPEPFTRGEVFVFSVAAYPARRMRGRIFDRLSDYRRDKALYAESASGFRGWAECVKAMGLSAQVAARARAGR